MSHLPLSEEGAPWTAPPSRYFEAPDHLTYSSCHQLPLPGELLFRVIPGAQTLQALTSGQPRNTSGLSHKFHVQICSNGHMLHQSSEYS